MPSTRIVVSTFLLGAWLAAGSLSAMEIWKFDGMADQDQATYGGLLVEGAERVLAAEGRTADVQKVHQLFSTTLPGDPMTVGMTQFEINLARARALDAKNQIRHRGTAVW